MIGGEIYVKKIPSMKVVDLAKTIAPKATQEFVGIRPGEKIHEQMIGEEDASSTYEYKEHYKILPVINGWADDPLRIQDGKKVNPNFVYNSGSNDQWMSPEQLLEWIEDNKIKLGKL